MPQHLYLYWALNHPTCYKKRRDKGKSYNLYKTPQRQHAWSKKALFTATVCAQLSMFWKVQSLDKNET